MVQDIGTKNDESRSTRVLVVKSNPLADNTRAQCMILTLIVTYCASRHLVSHISCSFLFLAVDKDCSFALGAEGAPGS